MDLEEGVLVKSANHGSRKRQKTEHQRTRAKIIRYQDHFPNLEHFERPCKHDGPTFHCLKIKRHDIIAARKIFFQTPDKVSQDRKLSYFCKVKIPKRRREKYKKDCRNQKHVLSTEYRLNKQDGKNYRVCQKMILQSFGISLKRLHTITRTIRSGNDITEKRGGNRRSEKYKEKRDEVRKFIGNLKAKESHYNRRKSKRLYLMGNLSINKLWKMYNCNVGDELKVKHSFFNKIFLNDFNVGFGSPASDVCSFCFKKKNSLKKCTDAKKKVDLITELRLHKLRAKQFHLMMNQQEENSEVFCFDLQQVQNLPKLPVGEAYYLRQLSFYNLCITDVSTRNPHFYTWYETQAGRGSNEIASALINFLNSRTFSADCQVLRLFADGCAGQNKNCYVMHALSLWLTNEAPPLLKEIKVTFPVRGHSFLPADRVFGRLEKNIRKIDVILNPEEYENIYREVGTVMKLGTDWNIKNYKAFDESLKKLNGIKDAKRILIKKDKRGVATIKMEQYYRNDDLSKKFESITKKGKNLRTLEAEEKELRNPIKKEKIRDLKTLLSLYDENWRKEEKFNFFKDFIEKEINLPCSTNQEVNEDDEDCDCNEEDGALRI